MTSKEIVERVTGSMNRCTSKIKNVLDAVLCAKTTDSFYRSLFETMDSSGIASISKICSEIEDNKDALNKISIKLYMAVLRI